MSWRQPRDGWYISAALDLIKTITRIKYVYVREKGEPAPDYLCNKAIRDYESGETKADAGSEDTGDGESTSSEVDE